LIGDIQDSTVESDPYSTPLTFTGATFAAETDLTSAGAGFDAEGDPLTYYVVTPPAQGQATIDQNGMVLYTTDRNFSGVDSFQYIASDGIYTSQPATITVTMPSNPNPPVVPVTVLGMLYLSGPPARGPLPPGLCVLLIPNPGTDPYSTYYNQLAANYDLGLIANPFVEDDPQNSPVGGAIINWDVKISPVASEQPFLGNVNGIGVLTPWFFTGTVLIPYTTDPIGVQVHEYVCGINIKS
jgi:hypothetical protein